MYPYKTSLVIPCFAPTQEHADMTVRCLESLKYGRPTEVILVDDASPVEVPGAGEDLRVTLEVNSGFPKAVNAGLREAKGDVLLIGNNDLTFTPGWLDAILKPLAEGYDISSIRTSDQTGYETEDKITEGDKFGCLWAMHRHVYDKLGGFDERFGRIYFEDTDYRRQAMEAGFKIAKNHAALVEHEGRATLKVIDPNEDNYQKAMQIYKEKWGTVD